MQRYLKSVQSLDMRHMLAMVYAHTDAVTVTVAVAIAVDDGRNGEEHRVIGRRCRREWRKIRNTLYGREMIETEAGSYIDRKRERERKAGGGSFCGLREKPEGAAGKGEGAVEAIRNPTAVGAGGGGGGGSFSTQDQSRGERPRTDAFASL